IVWGLPTSVMIEPTNRCNLHCPLCPVGAGMLTRATGEMSFDNFRRILDAIGPQLRRIYLWNQGEPLLNDSLPDMIRLAHERGIYMVTSTNGQLLGQGDIARRLVQSGLDEIILSVDGLTRETYRKYRIGGELEPVIFGMQVLRRERETLRRNRPKIILQWLPMKHNEHELPLLQSAARQWGADRVEIKTTQVYTKEQAEQFLPREPRFSRYRRAGERWETRRRYQTCRRLWFSCQIDWDGTIVPCCFDKNEDFAVGNIHHDSLARIWGGEKFQRFRQLLLTRGRTLDMCRNCTEGLETFYVSPRRRLFAPETETGTALARLSLNKASASDETSADT
ncbi:MAG: radical SAM protein, partial [Calditrichaeota bacterium]|nr:radical SAM protein [Calditrichota bacterium]